MSHEVDYRESDVGRRRSWHGLKKYAKRLLAWRVPNAALRLAVRFIPSLGATGRLPAPAHLREVAGTVRGADFVMLRPSQCIVAKELYWGGGRRPRSEDDLALEIVASVARHADMLLDVGAYTGIFTLACTKANPRLHAHAFEIVPEVFRLLFDNCVRNDVLDRVTLHHEGVGLDGGTMRVPAASGGSALPDFYSRRLHFDDGVSVRFVSLDSVARRLVPGSRIVMKIDVEGTENEVLAGASRFLAESRPDILCEMLAGVARADEVLAALAPHGYRFYLVREHDLLPAERIDPSPRFRDWFFTTLDPAALATMGLPVA